MRGLGCMKPLDWVDMKSKGLVMQIFQLDRDALLLLVYIPETWRNSSTISNYI
jgi:hypothetical protein